MRDCAYGDVELVEMLATFLVMNGRPISASTLLSLFSDTNRESRFVHMNMKESVELPRELIVNHKRHTVVYTIPAASWAFIIYNRCILATKFGSGESPEYVMIGIRNDNPVSLDFGNPENKSLIPAEVYMELLEHCNPQNPYCKRADLDNARQSFRRDVDEAKQTAYHVQDTMEYRVMEVKRKQEESIARVAQLEKNLRDLEATNATNTALGDRTLTMLETLTGQVNSVNAEVQETRTILQTHSTKIVNMVESHKTMQFHFMLAVVIAGLLFLVLYQNNQITQNELALQKAETSKIDSKVEQALQAYKETVKNQPTPNAQRYLPPPEYLPAPEFRPAPPPTPSTSTSSFSFWFMVVVFIIMACALVVMYGHSSMCMKEMKNQRLLMENGAY